MSAGGGCATGSLTGQRYYLFCARGDNGKTDISACANIGLAREIIFHVRSSALDVSIDTLIMQFMLIVYFPFLY